MFLTGGQKLLEWPALRPKIRTENHGGMRWRYGKRQRGMSATRATITSVAAEFVITPLRGWKTFKSASCLRMFRS